MEGRTPIPKDRVLVNRLTSYSDLRELMNNSKELEPFIICTRETLIKFLAHYDLNGKDQQFRNFGIFLQEQEKKPQGDFIPVSKEALTSVKKSLGLPPPKEMSTDLIVPSSPRELFTLPFKNSKQAKKDKIEEKPHQPVQEVKPHQPVQEVKPHQPVQGETSIPAETIPISIPDAPNKEYEEILLSGSPSAKALRFRDLKKNFSKRTENKCFKEGDEGELLRQVLAWGFREASLESSQIWKQKSTRTSHLKEAKDMFSKLSLKEQFGVFERLADGDMFAEGMAGKASYEAFNLFASNLNKGVLKEADKQRVHQYLQAHQKTLQAFDYDVDALI
jgi:hypothetical protein